MNSAPLPVVLIVDDEPPIRFALKVTLEEAGYAVIEAADGAEALALLAIARTSVAVVVTDLQMPGLDGIEFIERLGHWQPTLPVILASGDLARDTIPQASASRIAGFLDKPYSTSAVLELVAAAIARTASS